VRHRGLILVVEDNTDIRESVCLFLDDSGFRTATASNGKEAIDWLHSEEAPSLILLDLTMPVMDGYQFLTAKEADPLLMDVPVVVMTAVEDCSRLLGHQISECMAKPLSTPALLDAIERSARFA
jgi:CheY-like chemotaxis protein